MSKTRNPVNLSLPLDLVERLDEWCKSQEIPARRSQAVEVAIREFLDSRVEAT